MPFNLGGGEFVFILVVLLLLASPVVTWRRGGSGMRIALTLLLLFVPYIGWLVSWGIALTTKQGRKCPECAQLVPTEARVCRYCQHRFAGEEVLSPTPG